MIPCRARWDIAGHRPMPLGSMPLGPMPLGPMLLGPMPLGPMLRKPPDATPVVIAAVVVDSVVGGELENGVGAGRGWDFLLNAWSGMSLGVVRQNASRVNKLQLINHD